MQHYFAREADIELVEIVDFPMFNKPEDEVLPEIVKTVAEKLKQQMASLSVRLNMTMRCQISLMNALSWLSYGIFPFVDKPVMITGASYGTLGSSRAQAHLRQILDAPELKARIMPSSEFLLAHSLQAFDENNALKDSEQIDKLAGLFADFVYLLKLQNS